MSYIGKTPEAIGGHPLMAPLWFPSRAYLPAGYVPLDGQAVLRSLYPDATLEVVNGRVPVVSEAAWATATNRGSYTLGDGSTTIRLPDFNGKAVGSLGAAFLRGDGANSAVTNGVIQPGMVGPHNHAISKQTFSFTTGAANVTPSLLATTDSDPIKSATSSGTETRPINVTGCWAVKLFGVITTQAILDTQSVAAQVSANAAQLAATVTATFYSTNCNAATVHTVAHTMGDPSTWASVEYGMECTVANLGYSVGDRVLTQSTDGARIYGVNYDASNVRFLTNTSAVGIYQKTTASSPNNAITTTSWRFFIKITKRIGG